MQTSRSATALSNRYVEGLSPEQAVEVALQLSKNANIGTGIIGCSIANLLAKRSSTVALVIAHGTVPAVQSGP